MLEQLTLKHVKKSFPVFLKILWPKNILKHEACVFGFVARDVFLFFSLTNKIYIFYCSYKKDTNNACIVK